MNTLFVVFKTKGGYMGMETTRNIVLRDEGGITCTSDIRFIEKKIKKEMRTSDSITLTHWKAI